MEYFRRLICVWYLTKVVFYQHESGNYGEMIFWNVSKTALNECNNGLVKRVHRCRNSRAQALCIFRPQNILLSIYKNGVAHFKLRAPYTFSVINCRLIRACKSLEIRATLSTYTRIHAMGARTCDDQFLLTKDTVVNMLAHIWNSSIPIFVSQSENQSTWVQNYNFHTVVVSINKNCIHLVKIVCKWYSTWALPYFLQDYELRK